MREGPYFASATYKCVHPVREASLGSSETTRSINKPEGGHRLTSRDRENTLLSISALCRHCLPPCLSLSPSCPQKSTGSTSPCSSTPRTASRPPSPLATPVDPATSPPSWAFARSSSKYPSQMGRGACRFGETGWRTWNFVRSETRRKRPSPVGNETGREKILLA